MIKNIFALFGAHAAFQKIAGESVLKEGKKLFDKLTDDEKRAKLLGAILIMTDSSARANLRERYDETLPENGGMHGEENEFVNLLFPLVEAFKKSEDLNKILIQLGNASPEEFKKYLYFLKNDSFVQFLKKIDFYLAAGSELATPAVKSFRELLAEGGVK